MSKYTKKQKVAVALGAGAIAIAGGGVALAYWTTTGGGSGSATAGAPATAKQVTINQSGALTGFVLGDTKDVNVTATNNAAYSQDIGAIAVTAADSTGTNSGTCAASNWVITPVTNDIAALAGNATSSITKVATIQLKDDVATNQDACQGASPVLTFLAAAGS
jgi:hypothetical protein